MNDSEINTELEALKKVDPGSLAAEMILLKNRLSNVCSALSSQGESAMAALRDLSNANDYGSIREFGMTFERFENEAVLRGSIRVPIAFKPDFELEGDRRGSWRRWDIEWHIGSHKIQMDQHTDGDAMIEKLEEIENDGIYVEIASILTGLDAARIGELLTSTDENLRDSLKCDVADAVVTFLEVMVDHATANDAHGEFIKVQPLSGFLSGPAPVSCLTSP